MYTNKHNIPVQLLPWLIAKDYDLNPEDKTISVTSLLKPIRQTVLASRLPIDITSDISDLIASKIGSSIHGSVENSWLTGAYEALTEVGIPKKVVNRIVVNPDSVKEGDIPVYLEQRANKEIMGWKVSGKYDMVFDGQVVDIKTTSVITYMTSSREDDYRKQLSIYRWLNPDKITQDVGKICFIFTDWSRAGSYRSNYPATRIAHKDIPLMSYIDTDRYIRQRIELLIKNLDKPEPVECSDEELWFPAPTYAYYKNPAKLDRATKVFESASEADSFLVEQGSIGIVLPRVGKPNRCNYCEVASICKQRKKYYD